MQLSDLIVLSLSTFYAAYALSSTGGPWQVFRSIRTRVPLGGLTTCLICLSPWLAALFYVLLLTVLAPIVWILAAAGLSVFIWRYTGAGHVD